MHPIIPAGGNARLQPQRQRERKSEQKKDSLKRDPRQTAVFPNRVVLKQGNGKWDHSKNKQERDKKMLTESLGDFPNIVKQCSDIYFQMSACCKKC